MKTASLMTSLKDCWSLYGTKLSSFRFCCGFELKTIKKQHSRHKIAHKIAESKVDQENGLLINTIISIFNITTRIGKEKARVEARLLERANSCQLGKHVVTLTSGQK